VAVVVVPEAGQSSQLLAEAEGAAEGVNTRPCWKVGEHMAVLGLVPESTDTLTVEGARQLHMGEDMERVEGAEPRTVGGDKYLVER